MTEDQLNEYRVFHLAADVMVPLLKTQQSSAIERLLSRFRSGVTDLLSDVAKLEALYTLEEEISAKARTYEHHLEKRNKEKNP